jgi:hypothetical protein
MSFAPKNIMEEQTPQAKLEGLKLAPTEMDLIFIKEMKRIRQAAGLTATMRGVGRRHIDRLVGI